MPTILTEEQEDLPDHGHTEMELIILDLIAHADYFVYHFELELPANEAIEQSYISGFVSLVLTEIHIGFDHRGPLL